MEGNLGIIAPTFLRNSLKRSSKTIASHTKIQTTLGILVLIGIYCICISKYQVILRPYLNGQNSQLQVLLYLNGVMISMLTWNVKDCGFNTQSGQTKEELRRVGSKSG